MTKCLGTPDFSAESVNGCKPIMDCPNEVEEGEEDWCRKCGEIMEENYRRACKYFIGGKK